MVGAMDISVRKAEKSKLQEINFDDLPFGVISPIICWKRILKMGNGKMLRSSLISHYY